MESRTNRTEGNIGNRDAVWLGETKEGEPFSLNTHDLVDGWVMTGGTREERKTLNDALLAACASLGVRPRFISAPSAADAMADRGKNGGDEAARAIRGKKVQFHMRQPLTQEIGAILDDYAVDAGTILFTFGWMPEAKGYAIAIVNGGYGLVRIDVLGGKYFPFIA